MKALHTLWNSDHKIYHPLSDSHGSDTFGIMEIDVKDPLKRSSVVYQIAEERGISTDGFPKPSLQKQNKLLHEPGARLPRITAGVKGGIAFPPDDLKLKKPPGPFAPECSITQLTQVKSTVISFPPKQFTSLSLRVDGILRKATPADRIKDNSNIIVNITLSAQTEDLFNHISVNEMDVDNYSTKNIHINSHHPSLLKNCLLFDIEVILPTTLQHYKKLKIKSNRLGRLEGDLEDISFSRFTAGLGKGVIALKNVVGERIMLGTIYGMITGNYQPTETFDAAVIKGATIVGIEPRSKFLKSTVVALDGPVKATVSSGKGKPSYSSRLINHCWLCKPTTTSINGEQDIHIYSERRKSIQLGYYKEWSTTQHINVHSKYGRSNTCFFCM
ncbi:hypothetical protein BDF20DRAFT_886010 [Mycotypha africana]|uniref:uncharacterized protein n=1 Tax=Mycotypha africana TaxID=64632 RepID=UPI002301B613|nr:uncharacterized protein BDF20DRAFT_886010 [Mycotypha africana]KAI8971724.1 hypothetical protein BDF20DRAFT_886010 [Mycotypha africana]